MTYEEENEESDGYVLRDCAHGVHEHVISVVVPVGHEAEANGQVKADRHQKEAAYEYFVFEGGLEGNPARLSHCRIVVASLACHIAHDKLVERCDGKEVYDACGEEAEDEEEVEALKKKGQEQVDGAAWGREMLPGVRAVS